MAGRAHPPVSPTIPYLPSFCARSRLQSADYILAEGRAQGRVHIERDTRNATFREVAIMRVSVRYAATVTGLAAMFAQPLLDSCRHGTIADIVWLAGWSCSSDGAYWLPALAIVALIYALPRVEPFSTVRAAEQNEARECRYRGKPSYKGIPFTTLFAAFHPDSPVKDATCVATTHCKGCSTESPT